MTAVHFDGFIKYVVLKPDKTGGGRTQRGRLLVVGDDESAYGSITDFQANTTGFGIERDTLPAFPLRASSGTFTTTDGDVIRFGRMCSCSAPTSLSRIPQAELVSAALAVQPTAVPTEARDESPDTPSSPDTAPDEAEEKLAPTPADLDDLLKPALLELAQSYDLDVDSSMLKADIRAAVDQHLGY